MRKVITGVALLSTLAVFGQNQFVGLRGGIGLTSISADKVFNDVNSRTGFQGGLSYEYHFNNPFHFELGLEYNERGFGNDIIFTDEMGNPTGDRATTEFGFGYVSVPIKGGLAVGEKLQGVFNIGLVTSIPLKVEATTPEVENLDSETFDITNKVTKFDFGGIFEFGGSIVIREGVRMNVAIGYHQSLTAFTNEDYFESANARHNGMQFSIGLKYELKRKKGPSNE